MAKRLDLKDVNIYYGSFHAVADVALSVQPRSVTAFIGPSGCGKSTVLRTLNRMHEVIPGARVEGSVLLDGEDIYGAGVDPVGVRKTIGMVFQRPNPFPTMSIRDNVVAGLKLQGVRSKKTLDEVAERSLKGANLWNEVKDRLDKPGGGLSGGQQQRLCIARAIAVQPDVLLMDEPCSALDPISTLAIEDLIAELKQDFTIVIVTHNMQQAARVSDQTAFFNLEATGKPGRLIEIDDTEKIFSNPTAEGHRGLHLRPLRLSCRVKSYAKAPDCSGAFRLSAVHSARGGNLVLVGELAGDLEDDPAGDLDRVVGEPLVEPAQQRHVDRGGDAVLPFPVHQHGEQVAMQVVHRVVFLADPGGLLRIAGDQHLLRAVAQFDCDPAHFGEVAVDLFGQRMLRMAAAGDLGDVQRQRAHPVDVGDDLDRADDRAQVSGDRRLQRQQHERGLLGARAHRGDLLVVGDDLLGQHQIGLQQGLGCALHRRTCQPAHLAELSDQRHPIARGTRFACDQAYGLSGRNVTTWRVNER